MHRLIVFKIALFVIFQHILTVFGQRPKIPIPCPDNFLRIHNRCYYFSNEDDTWEGSKRKCDDRNSTLPVINSPNQNNALKAFLKKGYIASLPRWLGSQYDWQADDWKWIYSGKRIPTDLYDKKQFQNKELAWHCLTIDDNYSWNSDSCFNKNYYICQTKLSHRLSNVTNNNQNTVKNETVPSNLRSNSTEHHVSDTQPGYFIVNAGNIDNSVPAKGNEHKKKKKQKFICPKTFILANKKCYHFSREKAVWQNAFFKCEDLKADLAILKNAHQEKKLRLKVNKFRISNEPRWIGGQYDYKNNVWKWAATGGRVRHRVEALNAETWDCLIWDPNTTNKWMSRSCLTEMPYICQTAAKPAKKKNTTSNKTNPKRKLNARQT